MKNYFKAKTVNKNVELDKAAANLLYQIGVKIKNQIKNRTNFLIANVVEKKILNEPQLNGKLFRFFLRFT